MILAEECHFTRAARRCQVSQSALSQQIRLLEESVGLPLVIRGRRPVDLSDTGREILPKIQKILTEMTGIRSVCSELKEVRKGRLRVGMIPTIAPYLAREILPKWRARFPQITLDIRETTTAELVKAINHEEIDLAVASDLDGIADSACSAILEEPLITEALMLAVPSNKIDEQDQLPWLSLQDGHCLRDQALAVCKNEVDTGIRCHQMDTMIGLVASGLGVAVVPEMVVRHDRSLNLVFERLPYKNAHRVVQILSRHREQVNPVESYFRKALMDWARNRRTDFE